MAFAPVLAPKNATPIHRNTLSFGIPSAAINIEIKANGREKMVCENITRFP
jgi:hypothetical protein